VGSQLSLLSIVTINNHEVGSTVVDTVVFWEKQTSMVSKQSGFVSLLCHVNDPGCHMEICGGQLLIM
jgi:hypothetical protein